MNQYPENSNQDSESPQENSGPVPPSGIYQRPAAPSFDLPPPPPREPQYKNPPPPYPQQPQAPTPPTPLSGQGAYGAPQNNRPYEQQPQPNNWVNPSLEAMKPAPKPKSNKMIYLLVGGGVGCFALMLVFLVLVIGGLAYIGHHVPPTEIIAWGNIEKHHKEKVMKLGIIPPQENVLFVYSDELSFEEGCYILTDQSMIIHSAANDTETLKLTDVEFIEPYYGTAYEDGWVWLTLKNGENYGFPISGENGTDKKLVRRLQELSGAEFYVESDEDY